MRVCHVISGYHRNDARVFVRQCRSLRSDGHDVTLLTNDGGTDEVVEGISIVSCRRHWPRWKVLIAAKLQFMSQALELNADVYQLHSPELLPMASGLMKHGKAVVYDAHEDLPRHLLEKEWLPGVLRRPFGFVAEKYLLRTLSRINEVVSPHSHVVDQLQRVMGKGILIANFPIIQPLPQISKAEFAARPSAVCYTGTVYLYSNQEATLDAISAMPRIRYRIAGYIGEDHRRELAKRPGASQLEILGRVGRDALRELYLSCIAGLAVYDYKHNLGWKLGSYGTNKVFEYMEAGLPLICTDYDLWRDIVDRYDCGIYVRPGSVEEIRAAIAFLDNNRKRAFEMGQNGRRAVIEEFNWATEERKYVSVFRKLDEARESSREARSGVA